MGVVGNEHPSVIPPGGRALGPAEHAGLLDEMAEIVSTSHLFKSLDEEGRDRVLSSGYVCSFSAGETILRQGDHGSTMFLILHGKVRVETDVVGETIALAELGRDACIGEVSVLTGCERTATVTALSDVDTVAFERHRIERILADYPKVRSLLEALVAGRARDTIEKIAGTT
jgi:CRP/FNR family transcriptional regulator, cyclic AMP receptor protein